MNKRRLGKTNLNVSEFGHGLWGMGGWSGSDDRDSIDILEKSAALGCNFFDSAHGPMVTAAATGFSANW